MVKCNNLNRLEQGFTLIELMIVVAIIGILAAIAMPAYQDYTKRAHVTEGMALAEKAKMSVSEFYATNGQWPTSNESAGLPDATSIFGNAVVSVDISFSRIRITYNQKVQSGTYVDLQGTAVNGATLVWSCNTGTVPSQYLPSRCR